MKTLLSKDSLVFDPPELGGVLCLSALPGSGNKTYDRSPYGNAGTITGATWVRLPSGLWCLSFDGIDDFVNCGHHSSLVNLSDFTLMSWFKTSDLTVNQGILCREAAGSWQAYNISFEPSKGFVFCGTTNCSAWDILVYVTNTVAANQWYHVAATRNNTEAKLFVNMVLIGTQSNPGLPQTGTTDDVYVGRRETQYMKGNLSLASIYNRSLSWLEIQHHYAQEKPLVGVW